MSSKHSPALVIAIIVQFIAIIMAFSSFFLPIYTMKFTAKVDGVVDVSAQSEVKYKYRGYQCLLTNSEDSGIDQINSFSYDSSPEAAECLPFIAPGQDMSSFGYQMSVSLAVLALGFIGSVFTLLFTIIMSCHNSCRNIGMKIFAFIFSLVPFVFYLASPLVLLRFTYDFLNFESSQSSSADKDCQYWCQHFYGSETAVIGFPGLGNISGNVSWGPTYGWASGIVASVLALLSAILTVCSARYKKHHHHHHHHHDSRNHYTKLINQE